MLLKGQKLFTFLVCIIVFMTVPAASIKEVGAGELLPAEWDDEVVKAWVAHDLGVDIDDITFSPSEWEKQMYLNWGYMNYDAIHSIKCLAGQDKLYMLNLAQHEISDFSPLQNMQDLVVLDISKNPVKDFDALSSLVHLKKLTALNCPLEDVSSLKYLKQLNELRLSPSVEDKEKVNILDITGIENCTFLDSLELYFQPEDLSPISELQNLTNLVLKCDGISDFSKLGSHYYLEDLTLGSIEINDLSRIPFGGMKNIRHLKLSFADQESPIGTSGMNELTALEEIESDGNFENLDWFSAPYTIQEINLENATINDISVLKDVHIIRSLEIPKARLDDLSPLSGKNRMRYLEIGVYGDVDLTPISEMDHLYHLKIFNYAGEKLDMSPLVGSLPELEDFEINGEVDSDSLSKFYYGRGFRHE